MKKSGCGIVAFMALIAFAMKMQKKPAEEKRLVLNYLFWRIL